MEIRINTLESGPEEFTALIALFASLGGRLPAATTVTNNTVVIPPQIADTRGPVATPSREEDEPGHFPSADDITDATIRVLDSKGTPWDARIHSESKATVADGTWRKRRGVDEGTFERVMAELAATGNGAGVADEPSASAAAASPAADSDEAPPPPPADEGNDEDVPTPPAPTEDELSAPEPAASAPAAGDGQFADFPAFVGAVSKHGKTYAELNEMASTLGVPMFKDMKDHADKWDIFFSMIG